MCFYSLDRTSTDDDEAEIVPKAIARHATRLKDTAPAGRWECDLLEPAGEGRLREVVQKVKEGCEVLDG